MCPAHVEFIHKKACCKFICGNLKISYHNKFKLLSIIIKLCQIQTCLVPLESCFPSEPSGSFHFFVRPFYRKMIVWSSNSLCFFETVERLDQWIDQATENLGSVTTGGAIPGKHEKIYTLSVKLLYVQHRSYSSN